MKVRTRTNPKTGKTEYKVRYSWKDGEGKRKDSETAWFLTEKQAYENAHLLKLQKEANAKDGRINKRICLAGRSFIIRYF